MANNHNQQIIEEFRANGGKVGGYFANASLLLLTTTGAKSVKLLETVLNVFVGGQLNKRDGKCPTK